jgi:hypothetical protein
MGKGLSSEGANARLSRLLGAACAAVLVAVPLVQAFRGLDLTDTGFLLTNQRFIFSHPEKVTYWFHLWLTNTLGGIVDLLFGRFGILPHRLAAAAIFWGTAWAILRLYRREVPGVLILAGITVSMSFDFAGRINVVHYNNVSTLLYALGAALLCAAAVGSKRKLFFLSGLVLALNAFARLPNAIGLGLILVPWILGLFIRAPEDRFRLGWRDYAAFVAGALVAVAIAAAAMALLGHLGYYLRSLGSLADTRNVDAGSYGLGALIKRPLRDILRSLAYGLPFALGLAAVSAAVSALRRRIVSVVLLVAGAIVAYHWGLAPLVKGAKLYYVTAGLCYWFALAIVIDRRASRGFKLTAALSACVCLALNVGSDTGISVAAYAFPVLFPALLGYSAGALGRFRLGKASSYAPFRELALVAIAYYAGVSAFSLQHNVYRDVSSMFRTVRVEQLAHEYTSEARASAFEEAIPAIAAAAPPGSVLFAYDSLCLVHFATRTLPYLDNPWPALYSPVYLERLLEERQATEPLPPVLMAKSNPRSGAWPGNPQKPVGAEAVYSFIARNKYRLAWESLAFELYLPPGK